MNAPARTLPPLPDIRDVIRDLASRPERIEDICFEFFPAGFVQGGDRRFRIGSLAGDEGQSMSVLLSADPATGKAGNWKDFATGQGGDILDLVAQVLYAGDKRSAFWWALDRLNLKKLRAGQVQEHSRDQERNSIERAKEARRLENEKKATAWKIWHHEATPVLTDTPVEFYLRDRGIDLSAAPSTGALRYHDNLPLPYRRGFAPAMVGLVVSPAGDILGCHRTYLKSLPDGTWDRFREERDGIDGKFFLGPVSGGYISISKGPSGKTLANAPAGDKGLMIEGIEDAIIMAIARRDFRVMAGLSVGNLAAIRLPATITDRVLFLDNDTHPDAIAGAKRAVAAQRSHAQADGARLKVVKLEGVKDVNDFIRTAAR